MRDGVRRWPPQCDRGVKGGRGDKGKTRLPSDGGLRANLSQDMARTSFGAYQKKRQPFSSHLCAPSLRWKGKGPRWNHSQAQCYHNRNPPPQVPNSTPENHRNRGQCGLGDSVPRPREGNTFPPRPPAHRVHVDIMKARESTNLRTQCHLGLETHG